MSQCNPVRRRSNRRCGRLRSRPRSGSTPTRAQPGRRGLKDPNMSSSGLQTGRIIGLILATAALSACLACGGGSVSTQAASSLSPVTLTLTPATLTIPTSGIQAFTAVVNNAPSQSVSWQVNGITGGNVTYGTIDKNGNYTAPAYVP